MLTYADARGVTVVDSARPNRPRYFPAGVAANPTQLALALQGPEVKQARMVALPLPKGATRRDVFAANQRLGTETAL